MRSLAFYLGVSRAPFLLLTLSILFFAVSLVFLQIGMFPIALLGWVVLSGLCAHIAVNALNEYHDFKSGLDELTKRTPFSGGSGTLPAHPEGGSATLMFAFLCLAICIGVGIYLVLRVNANLLFFGMAGVVIVLTYTPWINQNPWLCLLAPGAGFGLIMLPGAVLALGGSLDHSIWLAATSVFFIVNNLLLLNQLPDVEADKQVGRRTLPIVKGQRFTLLIATLFFGLAFSSVIIAVSSGAWPETSLFVGLLLPLAGYSLISLASDQGANYSLSGLAANVLFCIVFPFTLALAILL